MPLQADKTNYNEEFQDGNTKWRSIGAAIFSGTTSRSKGSATGTLPTRPTSVSQNRLLLVSKQLSLRVRSALLRRSQRESSAHSGNKRSMRSMATHRRLNEPPVGITPTL